VRLSLHDAGGRLVRRLAAGTRAAGWNEVPWDGRDRTGRSVAPGVYFVRLEAAGQRSSARVVRLR